MRAFLARANSKLNWTQNGEKCVEFVRNNNNNWIEYDYVVRLVDSQFNISE